MTISPSPLNKSKHLQAVFIYLFTLSGYRFKSGYIAKHKMNPVHHRHVTQRIIPFCPNKRKKSMTLQTESPDRHPRPFTMTEKEI